MKKNLIILLLLASTTLFTSCLTILEKITLQKNGSGTYAMTIDMSEMMDKFGMFMPDSIKQQAASGYDDEAKIQKRLDKLNQLKGISNAKANNPVKYSYEISYDFADMDALNNALKESEKNSQAAQEKAQTKINKDTNGGMDINAQLGDSETSIQLNKKFGKRKLIRNTLIKSEKDNEALQQMGSDSSMGAFGSMFASPTYKVVYELPKKIKEAKIDSAAKVQQQDKTITIEYDLMKLFDGGKSQMSHEISY